MVFCTELLLKLLLINSDKSIKELKRIGHDLQLLYNALPQDDKDLICSSFKMPLIYDINEELGSIKKAFVDWRYLVFNKAEENGKAKSGGRVPFSKRLKGKTNENKTDNERLRVKPFFLKEFNEILFDVCKNSLEKRWKQENTVKGQ